MPEAVSVSTDFNGKSTYFDNRNNITGEITFSPDGKIIASWSEHKLTVALSTPVAPSHIPTMLIGCSLSLRLRRTDTGHGSGSLYPTGLLLPQTVLLPQVEPCNKRPASTK